MSRFSRNLGCYIGRMLKGPKKTMTEQKLAGITAEEEALRRVSAVEETLCVQELEIQALGSALAIVRAALHSQQERLSALVPTEKTEAESNNTATEASAPLSCSPKKDTVH